MTLRLPALLAGLLLAGSAMAQGFPTKPLTLIVPFPAAGATDIAARQVSQRLSAGTLASSR